MSANHKTRFQQPRATSLVVLQKKLDKISSELDAHKKNMDAVVQSYNHHMDYLSNFARHDMGNAIQNISATLKTIEGKVNPEIITALKSSVANLNSTLDNLGKLIPYSPNRTFRLPDLIIAVEILVRSSSRVDNIALTTRFDRENSEEINQPFQALLQLLHNLIINAQKALRNISGEKRILIEANMTPDKCVIRVMDNGCGIPPEHISTIFEYGFTTTNGSGIGLFHAKYLCMEIGGDISVTQNENGFSTIFTLTFPKDGAKKNSGN